MCSIFSILDIQSDAKELRQVALEMSKLMRHRGLTGQVFMPVIRQFLPTNV